SRICLVPYPEIRVFFTEISLVPFAVSYHVGKGAPAAAKFVGGGAAAPGGCVASGRNAAVQHFYQLLFQILSGDSAFHQLSEGRVVGGASDLAAFRYQVCALEANSDDVDARTVKYPVHLLGDVHCFLGGKRTVPSVHVHV